MTESILTPSEAKYIKSIYRRQVEEGRKLRTMTLARAFDVHPATVTETLRKLADKDLIEYTPYYGAELTERGIIKARKMLRKHRILEVLFVRLLNYDAENACEEASKLDHYFSSSSINAICRTYDHPETCPCNKRIFTDKECCEL